METFLCVWRELCGHSESAYCSRSQGWEEYTLHIPSHSLVSSHYLGLRFILLSRANMCAWFFPLPSPNLMCFSLKFSLQW